MPGFPYGLNRAFTVVFTGFVLALVVRVVLESLGYRELIILFDLVSISLIILLFQKMNYWSLSYLFGWVVGLMAFCIILEPWEIVLYVVVTFSMLFIKIFRKFG